jgi:hypothetical protein
MTSLSVPAELLDPVVAYFRPQRVILFGSTARREAGPDSDFDQYAGGAAAGGAARPTGRSDGC